MDARWILSATGMATGLIGYVPEMARVLRHADERPASHVLWTLWVSSAVLNYSYVLVIDAPLLVKSNYLLHLVMGVLSMAANVWRWWRCRTETNVVAIVPAGRPRAGGP
jgi:hypothetical protein